MYNYLMHVCKYASMHAFYANYYEASYYQKITSLPPQENATKEYNPRIKKTRVAFLATYWLINLSMYVALDKNIPDG